MNRCPEAVAAWGTVPKQPEIQFCLYSTCQIRKYRHLFVFFLLEDERNLVRSEALSNDYRSFSEFAHDFFFPKRIGMLFVRKALYKFLGCSFNSCYSLNTKNNFTCSF